MKRYLPLLLLALAGAAHAQTFTVTPATGSGPKTATWNIPGGTNCQAGGDWSGAKAASGTQQITGLAVGSHTFTFACTVPGPIVKSSVTLSWLAPTQNVDGTALTNLAGYKIYYGNSATALNQTVNLLTNPGLLRYTVEDLGTGTWFFAITALNSAGAESDKSGTVSKALTDTQTTEPWTGTATADVTATKPKAPVLSIVGG